MSKSYSNLFEGTKGASNKSDKSTNATTYHATTELKNHIVEAEQSSSGRSGIKGAHNKDNFLKEVSKTGARVTGSTPNSQVDGIEKISYNMPKKDKYGNITDDYQSKTFYKTVYDSSKISDDTYIKWGLQAANNSAKLSSAGKLAREWSGKDNQGVSWHGYCDNNGNITSFFPED